MAIAQLYIRIVCYIIFYYMYINMLVCFFIGASLSEPHTDKFRFCRVYIYIYMYIYIYAPYVRLTVYFYLQQRQRLRRSIERERWACGC